MPVSWETDELANGTVDNHSFTLHNLEPGATYNLVIKAKNETNNEVASSPLSFNTTIDKTPPTISNLSANSTLFPGQNSKVQTIISWTTDEPSTAAVYYQEGVSAQSQVETSTVDNNFSEKHIIVLTSFKPGTVYKYWIESEDTSHNIVTSSVFTMLTPIEKKTIIDIISKNFQSVFGWTKHVGL